MHMVLLWNEKYSANISNKWKWVYGYDTWETQHIIIFSITLASLSLLISTKSSQSCKKNTKNKKTQTTMMDILALSVSNFTH